MANPVQIQPAPGGPPAQTGLAGVPQGLQSLIPLDQLLVRQQVELVEAFVGIETGNRYEVISKTGQILFSVKEDRCCESCCVCCSRVGCKSLVKCCTRQCCQDRSTSITITDIAGNKILWLNRPCRSTSCFCPCCLQKMDVFDVSERKLGAVHQTWSICKPAYAIRDENDEVVLRIKGPVCTTSICANDVEFDLMSKDGETEVGKVSKKWSGIGKEAFSDADNFGISFPMDLDVKVKATVMAACLLIDYMFFETSPADKRPDMPGMVG